MLAARSATGATSELVARILCIICSVLIISTNSENADRFDGPMEDMRIGAGSCANLGNTVEDSVEACLDKCLSYGGTLSCNTVNIKPDVLGCELYMCGNPFETIDWQGWDVYTLNPDYTPPPTTEEPTTSPPTDDIYVGPLPKIWTDCQCRPIRHHHDKSFDQCRTLCSDDEDCTAINFSDADCILRACPIPVPPPTLRYPPFKGYANEADIRKCEVGTRRCTRNKGKCLPKIAWPTCEGKLDRRMCRGIHCGCCIPQ